jgi:large subunit ribosomal protein L35
MPKMKTNRGAYKRLLATGTGKLRRKRAFKNHILTKKASKRKRQLRQDALVHESDEKRMNRLLPYGAR